MYRGLVLFFDAPVKEAPRLLNRTSYTRMSKKYVLLIALSSILFFLILLLFSTFADRFNKESLFVQNVIEPLIIPSRFIYVLVGPLLAFFGYYFLILFFMYEETKRVGFGQIAQFTLTGGLTSVLLALTLNTRAFQTFVQGLVLIVSPNIALFFAYAVVGPFIEETAKALPIFFLAVATITSREKRHETRLLNSGRLPILIGFTTGAIFNVLETYNYVFQSGYILDLAGDDNVGWQLMTTQITLRGINILHILCAGIAGYGISHSLWSSRSRIFGIAELRVSLPYFGLAIFIHGLWNGNLVLSELSYNSFQIQFLYLPMPLLNFLMIPTMIMGLVYLVYRSSLFSDEICPYCGNWHAEPYDKENHLKALEETLTLRPTVTSRIISSIKPDYYTYHCQSCNKPLNPASRSCNNPLCSASKVFACRKCNAPIPAYSSRCWRCNQAINPVFDKVFSYRERTSDKYAEAIIMIFIGFYLPNSFALLFYTSINGYSTLVDRFGIIYLFFTLFSIIYIVILKWLNSSNNKAMGISLARTIVAMVIIQLSFLLMLLGIISLLSNMILAMFLFIIESAVLLYYSGPLIFSFRPLFHYELEHSASDEVEGLV